MNEAEIRLLEQAIEQLKKTQIELQTERTELEYRIEEVKDTIQTLIRLLPVDKRIDRLFH